MTNASALPVQRQVLEQLFITDPKVGFGQAPLLSICHSDLSNIIQCQQNKWLKPTCYITHKTLCSSLILMLFALYNPSAHTCTTSTSHLNKSYLRDLMKVVVNLYKPFITDFTNSVDEFVIICYTHYHCTLES